MDTNVNEKFPNGGAEMCSHPWFSDIDLGALLEDKAQFVPITEIPKTRLTVGVLSSRLNPY